MLGSASTDEPERLTASGAYGLPRRGRHVSLSRDLYAKHDRDLVTLYVGAGISWYSIEAEVDFHFLHGGYAYDGRTRIDSDADISLNVFAGVRAYLFGLLNLFAEVRYDFETDIDLRLDDTTIAELEGLGGATVVGRLCLLFRAGAPSPPMHERPRPDNPVGAFVHPGGGRRWKKA